MKERAEGEGEEEREYLLKQEESNVGVRYGSEPSEHCRHKEVDMIDGFGHTLHNLALMVVSDIIISCHDNRMAARLS